MSSRLFLLPQVKCADLEEAWAPSTALRGMVLSRTLLTSLPSTPWAEFSSLLTKLWTGGREISPLILKGQWTSLFTFLVLIVCIWKWGCWVGSAPTFGSYTPAKAKETGSQGIMEQKCHRLENVLFCHIRKLKTKSCYYLQFYNRKTFQHHTNHKGSLN